MATIYTPETEEERRRREEQENAAKVAAQTAAQQEAVQQNNVQQNNVQPGAVTPVPQTPAEKIEQSYKDYGTALSDAATKQAGAVREANAGYNTAMDTAQQNLEASNAATLKSIQDYLNAGYTAQQALIKEREDEMQRERDAAETEYRANQRAARWTGLTELAASIANMIGVGSFNASNQTYKNYSQDWMKKADEDLKYRRSRIDNLREKQNTLRQQLLQLQMQGGKDLAEFQRNAANTEYNNAVTRAAADRDTEVTAAGIEAKGTQGAAEAALRGVAEGVETGLKERQIANSEAAQQASIAQGWAKINEDKRQFDESSAQSAARYGLIPDGKGGYVQDPDAIYYGTGRGSSTSSSNSSRNSSSGSVISFEITVDGKREEISLNEKTFDTAVKYGKEDVKKDVERILAEREKNGGNKKKGRRADPADEEYNRVLEAISGTGDSKEDDAVIEQFIQGHMSELNEFNKRLKRIASGGRNAEDGQRNKPTPPAPTPTNPGQQIDTTAVGSGEDLLEYLKQNKK